MISILIPTIKSENEIEYLKKEIIDTLEFSFDNYEIIASCK